MIPLCIAQGLQQVVQHISKETENRKLIFKSSSSLPPLSIASRPFQSWKLKGLTNGQNLSSRLGTYQTQLDCQMSKFLDS